MRYAGDGYGSGLSCSLNLMDARSSEPRCARSASTIDARDGRSGTL